MYLKINLLEKTKKCRMFNYNLYESLYYKNKAYLDKQLKLHTKF